MLRLVITDFESGLYLSHDLEATQITTLGLLHEDVAQILKLDFFNLGILGAKLRIIQILWYIEWFPEGNEIRESDACLSGSDLLTGKVLIEYSRFAQEMRACSKVKPGRIGVDQPWQGEFHGKIVEGLDLW